MVDLLLMSQYKTFTTDCTIIMCAPAGPSEAGIVLVCVSVCLSVYLSVCVAAQTLKNY